MTIRAAAAVLCAVVALAGCSSDPEPQPLPPVATSSPSPIALPLPSEAAAETPEGAAAFARYFLEVVNQGLVSGDGSGLSAISESGCGGCRSLLGAIEQAPKQGERIEGGLFQVLSAEAPPVEDGDVIVEVQYEVTEVRVFGSDGTLLRSTPALGARNGQVRLLRRDSGWVVQGFRSVNS